MIEYYIENPRLLSIRFENDPETVRLVKVLPGRYYDGQSRKWLVPIVPALYEPLIEFSDKTHSDIPGYILAALIETRDFIRNNFIGSSAIAPNYNEVERISPLFRDLLYPYQQAGVLYGLKNRTVIIADEMGLGKTVQSLAIVESAQSYPALIICPASLKINWLRECQKWMKEIRAYIIDGSDISDAAQVLIVNYDALKKYEWLSTIPWSCVIVDEAHFIKNEKSARTVLTERITRQAERVILMTGTPVINCPFDLVSLLRVCRKLDLFGGFWGFVQEYCDAKKTRYGWDFKGSANLDELNIKLRECGYLRREKNEVLTELPEKIRQNLYIEIDNSEEYKLAEDDLIKYLRVYRSEEKSRNAMRAKILVGISTLRQITIEGKINTIFSWIENFQNTSNSLIIFGWHKEVLNAISEKFQCDVFNGETEQNEKQKMIDDFQQGKTKMIAINIQAGGVGLTLTAATHELFVEFPWTNAAIQQAEDRAHRIGQKNALNIYRAIGVSTIDEMFLDMIERKRGVSDEAISNTDDIDFLIQALLEKG